MVNTKNDTRQIQDTGHTCIQMEVGGILKLGRDEGLVSLLCNGTGLLSTTVDWTVATENIMLP